MGADWRAERAAEESLIVRDSGWPVGSPQCNVVARFVRTEDRDEAVRIVNAHDALVAALTKIEKWVGEFPATGKFWENADGTMSDRPRSYGAQFGSNGERDFMRSVARDALAIARGGK
ncbi:MAG: hypothetical protein EOR99_35060 [Mesorhizobium sp.]|nr:MAG: hypothetical protein EOR99_35060 [Mesorhizobium sp.]